MNHNNIYSILGKLESLTPKEEAKPEVPSLKEYANVPAQGSIIAGVKTIEETLSEKYMGFKKTVAAIEKGGSARDPEAVAAAIGRKKYGKAAFQKAAAAGKKMGEGETVCAECGMAEGSCEHSKMEEEKSTTHKGGEVSHKDGVTKHTKKDFPGYPTDDINKDDDEDHPKDKKAGRPRKHAKKADTGEKKGRGRPKKDKPAEYDKRHDPFGRVKSGAEKSGKEIKGKKHSMDEVAPPGDEAERMVKHIKKSYSNDGKLTPKEKSIAYATAWKAHNRGTVEEAMTRLQQRLTEGVNFAELLREKQQTVDEMLAELGNDIKVFKETGHCSELLRDCMEIKGYHGKMVADEAAQVPSNPDPFHATKGTDLVSPQQRVAGATPAKPGVMGAVKDVAKGVKNWLTGKPDQGPTYEEVTLEDELNELARLAGLDEVSRGEYIKQQDAAAEKSGKDKFNAFGQIFNTDEIKEEPNEGNLFTKGLEDDDVKIGDKIPGTDAIKTKDIDEDKIEVADAPEAKNKPNPKYATIKHITTQGDDLHREKSQNPGAAAKGDNPLTNKLTLEDRLAAEYESIKKVTK